MSNPTYTTNREEKKQLNLNSTSTVIQVSCEDSNRPHATFVWRVAVEEESNSERRNSFLLLLLFHLIKWLRVVVTVDACRLSCECE